MLGNILFQILMFVIIWDIYFICYLMLLYAFGDNSLDAI